MSGATAGGGTARLERILDRLRALGDGEGPGARTRDELDELLSALWQEFAPHEDDERRMAERVGGSAPDMVRLAQRHLHRHLALLSKELRGEGWDAHRRARVAREAGAVEALVEAQLEIERWLAHHLPEPPAAGAATCRWCGAPLPALTDTPA